MKTWPRTLCPGPVCLVRRWCAQCSKAACAALSVTCVPAVLRVRTGAAGARVLVAGGTYGIPPQMILRRAGNGI